MAVVLNYVPHSAQRAIHEARMHRFRTVCTGRRFGKTLCLAAELLDRGGCESGGDYGWVAPTYNVAERGVEAFRTIAEGFVRVVGRMPTRVEFEGNAGPVRIWFLSADNPDNIRGYGFRGIVVDEAAMIPKDVWHFVLRPTIAQTMGWAVFVSTPKGRNWFFDLFTRGMDALEPDYTSLSFPSNASPFFPESEWEDARRTLPEDVFRQEYMAEFLEDSAGVFRNVDGCLIWDEESLKALNPARGGAGVEGVERGEIGTANGPAEKRGAHFGGQAQMEEEDVGTTDVHGLSRIEDGEEKEEFFTTTRCARSRKAEEGGGGEESPQRTQRTQRIRDFRKDDDVGWRRDKVRDVVVGCDVAKHTDFTVLIAMDAATGRCFAMERFNHLDWPVQKERILSFARNVRGRLILDATGVGDPIYDDLKRVYPDVEGFKLTNASKTQLIQRLIVAVEQRKVSWPAANGMAHGAWGMAGNSFKSLNVEVVKGGGGLPSRPPSHKASDGYSEASAGAGENWAILTSELKRYEYAISPTGVITYNAPAGYHDDCVIALALANWRRWESENVGRMLPVGGSGPRGVVTRRRGRVLVA
jgi:hypothetical protein